MAREMIELLHLAEQEALNQEQHALQVSKATIAQAQEQAKHILENEIAKAKAAASEMQKQTEHEITRLSEVYAEETKQKMHELAANAQNAKPKAIKEVIQHIRS